jgi:hypothetical protein
VNAFLAHLMPWKETIWNKKKIWKFVDGQYIQYTCNVLTHQDSLTGQLSKKKHNTIRDILS